MGGKGVPFAAVTKELGRLYRIDKIEKEKKLEGLMEGLKL